MKNRARGVSGRSYLIFGAAIVSVACGGPVAKVRARAPFDLACPEGAIQYQKLDRGVIGAAGCGKRATYIVPCNLLGECGAAEMNTAGQGAQQD